MGNDWLLIGFAAFVLTGTGRSVIRGRGRESIAPSRTLPAKEKKPKKWRMER